MGATEADTVIGYVRVSTAEQGDSGLGLEAQRDRLKMEAAHRGWHLRVIEDSGVSGASLNRPGVGEALAALKSGEATALVVAKLDRLSRSIIDVASLMERASKEGWSLIALDLGVDTTNPAGELVANVMASVAQWERRVIGQRTAEALAARKREGVRLGRPVEMPQEVRSVIGGMRKEGASLAAIATHLNDGRVPTVRGGRQWWPSTVGAALKSMEEDVSREWQ